MEQKTQPPFMGSASNPYVDHARNFDRAVNGLRSAANKIQAVDCLRSIRYFLEIAEAELKQENS